MKREVCSYVIALGVLLSAVATFAQDAGKATKKPGPGTTQSDASKDKKAGGKNGRRLPPYYAKVVDQTQRKKIYAIQETYDPQINKLEEEVRMLKEKRDSEIRAVLSAEQLKQVDEMAAEAKAARKKSVSIPNAATGEREKTPAAK